MAAAAPAAVLGSPGRSYQPAAPQPDFAAVPSQRGDEAGQASAPGAADRPPPQHVLVPHTALDTRIGPVGVTDQGGGDVPDSPDAAGRYRCGPAPGGSRRSSLPVAHVGPGPGGLGESPALYDARREDRVEVRRAGGEPVNHHVASLVTAPKDDLPPPPLRGSLAVTAEPVEPGRALWPM